MEHTGENAPSQRGTHGTLTNHGQSQVVSRWQGRLLPFYSGSLILIVSPPHRIAISPHEWSTWLYFLGSAKTSLSVPTLGVTVFPNPHPDLQWRAIKTPSSLLSPQKDMCLAPLSPLCSFNNRHSNLLTHRQQKLGPWVWWQLWDRR